MMSSGDGVSWPPGIFLLNEQTQMTPSVAVYMNRLWVAFTQNNNEVQSALLVCSSADGIAWTGNRVTGQQAINVPQVEGYRPCAGLAFVVRP